MNFIEYISADKVKKTGIVTEDLKFIVPDAGISEITDGSIAQSELIDIESVTLLTPGRPSKIVCVGRNYAEHAAELGNQVPTEPLLFLKAPSALIFDGDYIEIPPQSNQVEYEGELGVVIGKTLKNLAESEDPLDYVLGFICLNDVTARDLQRKDVQFARAKSFDTFLPAGKFIARGVDVKDLQVTTKINGILKQNGRTSQMIFAVDYLLKYISRQMTLNFGDIIATGTPAGVSSLNPGDVCEVEITGVGKISNPVRNAPEL